MRILIEALPIVGLLLSAIPLALALKTLREKKSAKIQLAAFLAKSDSFIELCDVSDGFHVKRFSSAAIEIESQIALLEKRWREHVRRALYQGSKIGREAYIEEIAMRSFIINSRANARRMQFVLTPDGAILGGTPQTNPLYHSNFRNPHGHREAG